MSKEKNFGDLVVGDIVWREKPNEWRLVREKVIEIEPEVDCVPEYVRISLSNGLTFSARSDSYVFVPDRIWSDKECVIQYMNERANRMEPEYIKRIDELVSKYDNLLKWKKEHLEI